MGIESNISAGPDKISFTGRIMTGGHHTHKLYIRHCHVANAEPKTASNYTGAFDLLLDAYKDIGDNLPQFKKYAQLFGNKPSVQKVLVEVFEGILRFHKRAIGFFRRSGLSLPSLSLCIWAAWGHGSRRIGLSWVIPGEAMLRTYRRCWMGQCL